MAEKRALEAADKAEAKAAELEAREEKRLRELEERQAQEQYEQVVYGFRSQYANAVSAEKHPFLNALSREVVAQRALDAANHYAKVTADANGVGLVPDTNELIDYLEKVEREEFEARAGKVGFARQAVKQPEIIDGSTLDEHESPRGVQITPDVKAGQSYAGVTDTVVRDSRGRFVVNSDAAARVHTSTDPRDMTEEQRLKRAAQRIAQGWAKDSQSA